MAQAIATGVPEELVYADPLWSFDDVHHEYKNAQGRVVPSVTQTIASAGLADISRIPRRHLEAAQQFGEVVHEWCQLLDEDADGFRIASASLGESKDPGNREVLGCLLAYTRFKNERQFQPRIIEGLQVTEFGGLEFGMCVDRAGELDGKPAVVDIKTPKQLGQLSLAWPVQTAAYAAGLKIPDATRLVVHLHRDGSYNVLTYRNPRDLEAWLHALWTVTWKMEQGIRLRDLP